MTGRAEPSSVAVAVGVLTVSDRASRGEYEDKGGPGIIAALTDILATPWRPVTRIVPDEQPLIEAALPRTGRAGRAASS